MRTKIKLEARCPPHEVVAKSGKLQPGKKVAFDKELAKLCKALAHPARVRIVQLLLKRQTCMCGDIVEELPLAQSTVSQHLKVLKLAGVIYGEVDGPRRCYCVTPTAITHLQELLNLL